MKCMSLIERADYLRSEHSISISSDHLRTIYRKSSIRYKTVDLHMTQKLLKADDLKKQQRKFVIEVEQLKLRTFVWFMDSTSISAWSSLKKKTWNNCLFRASTSFL